MDNPGNQYSKGFAGYDKVEAFDKMVDWLEQKKKVAFKELKRRLRKSYI